MANDTWTNPAGPSAGTASLSEMQQQRTDNLFVVQKALFDGDVSAAKAHRHKSGTYANLPASGNAGRMYYATDFDLWFHDNGTYWYPAWPGSGCEHYESELQFQPSAEGWSEVVTGSGVITVANPVSYTGSSLQTGTTSSSNAEIRTPQPIYAVARGLAWLEFRLYDSSPARTNHNFFAGLRDTAGNNAVDFFKSSGATEQNWTCETKSGGVATTNVIAATTGSAFFLFRIIIISATSVQFWVDNVLKFTHTTNIPTANLNVRALAINTAAEAKSIDVDDIRWWMKR